MIKILVIIVILVAIAAAVYYFGFYKKGKINDRDGDLIPDEVEDTVKEVKRRAKRVKKELKDVGAAAKNLASQSKDVIDAAKGKKRKGRKPKKVKNSYYKLKKSYLIMNLIQRKIMAFRNLFKDNNDINEKSIIGFISFLIMVIFAVTDLVTGYLGKDLVINEFIYDSFTFITLGCFGIAGVEKIFSKK